MNPHINNVKAYSIAGFCQAYSIGKTKAYDEIKKGRLKIKKVGKRTLVTAEDAAEWLQNNGNGDLV